MDKSDYTPRAKTAETLTRGLAMVNSVPYQVSARWVFYRLLQEGYYSKKSDYKNKWIKSSGAARKAFWGGWHPDTMADETRAPIIRGDGYRTPADWLRAQADYIECNLGKWYNQPTYIELWFEARAMADQFRHYTQHITLRPMAGQPSIPFKWETAKHLERMAARYGKPVVILYFGDLDEGGTNIENAIRQDVTNWCNVSFEFIRCGLNPGDPERYGIPENPEKPGYQWEALPDAGAQEIIKSNVKRYVRQDAFTRVEKRETEATSWIQAKLADLEVEYTNRE